MDHRACVRKGCDGAHKYQVDQKEGVLTQVKYQAHPLEKRFLKQVTLAGG